MLSSRFLHDVDSLRRRADCLPKLRRRRLERVNLSVHLTLQCARVGAASERRQKIAHGFNRGLTGKRGTSPGGAADLRRCWAAFSVVPPGLDFISSCEPTVENGGLLSVVPAGLSFRGRLHDFDFLRRHGKPSDCLRSWFKIPFSRAAGGLLRRATRPILQDARANRGARVGVTSLHSMFRIGGYQLRAFLNKLLTGLLRNFKAIAALAETAKVGTLSL